MLEKKITIQERLKIRRYISNHTTEETARKFNVSVSSVYKIVNNGCPAALKRLRQTHGYQRSLKYVNGLAAGEAVICRRKTIW